MHEYKKGCYETARLITLILEWKFIEFRNNKAPTFVEALLFKYGTGGRT